MVKNLCPDIDRSKPGEVNSISLPHLKHVIIINNPFSDVKKEYRGTWRYADLAEGKITGNTVEFPEVTMDDPFLILFTSGTTGRPKVYRNSIIINIRK